MVGWHHRLDGPEFEQAPGVGDGQGSLTCCSPWGSQKVGVIELTDWRGLYTFESTFFKVRVLTRYQYQAALLIKGKRNTRPSASPCFCVVNGGGGGCAVSSLAGRPDLVPGAPASLSCWDLGVRGGPT